MSGVSTICQTSRNVWLAPTPSRPFVEMVDGLAFAFPEHPPFSGEFATVIPHLTVAASADEDLLDRVREPGRRRPSNQRAGGDGLHHATRCWTVATSRLVSVGNVLDRAADFGGVAMPYAGMRTCLV